MAVREKGGKWYVVKKNGSLGKRGYTKRSSAEAAQARGRAMASSSPLSTPAAAGVPEGRGLGIGFTDFPGYRGTEKFGVVHSYTRLDAKGKRVGKKVKVARGP